MNWVNKKKPQPVPLCLGIIVMILVKHMSGARAREFGRQRRGGSGGSAFKICIRMSQRAESDR